MFVQALGLPLFRRGFGSVAGLFVDYRQSKMRRGVFRAELYRPFQISNRFRIIARRLTSLGEFKARSIAASRWLPDLVH